MSVVTYTALREIEKLPYLIAAATDISASDTDDSLNSVSTDLSGLLDDQWIEASGFANQGNNGWFQADGNSTANKISQDTGPLITEAAGAQITIQGYKRGLGQSYSIQFTPRLLQPDVTVIDHESESEGGAVEVVFERRVVAWELNSGRLLESDEPQFLEFLSSVEGGEPFLFDPYGTIAVPDEPRVCMLARRGYNRQRLGVARRYIIPLQFREL